LKARVSDSEGGSRARKWHLTIAPRFSAREGRVSQESVPYGTPEPALFAPGQFAPTSDLHETFPL